jgi:hypothetical protein
LLDIHANLIMVPATHPEPGDVFEVDWLGGGVRALWPDEY